MSFSTVWNNCGHKGEMVQIMQNAELRVEETSEEVKNGGRDYCNVITGEKKGKRRSRGRTSTGGWGLWKRQASVRSLWTWLSSEKSAHGKESYEGRWENVMKSTKKDEMEGSGAAR